MLPNKEEATTAQKLPNVKTAQSFQVGDVLISNIKPYFKKIWFANKEGGCSNDVLVLRANESYNPRFLYYVLSDDNFFEYTTDRHFTLWLCCEQATRWGTRAKLSTTLIKYCPDTTTVVA